MEQYVEKSQLYNENPNSKSGQKHNNKGKKKPIKIKYISSPMMVRANNASEFRAIVQELTGQNSNLADNYNSSDDHFVSHHHHYYDNHDDQIMSTTGWFPSSTAHHDHDAELVGRTDVHDHEKFSKEANSIVNVPFGGQFDDEANQFWRSDQLVSDQSFNGGFQSPCVFV